MGEGDGEGGGRQRLADRFEHPPGEGGDAFGRGKGRFAFVQVGVEEAREEGVFFIRDMAEGLTSVSLAQELVLVLVVALLQWRPRGLFPTQSRALEEE